MNIDEIKDSWKTLDKTKENDLLNQTDVQQISKKRNSWSTLKILLPEIIIFFFYLYLIVFLIAFNGQLDSLFNKTICAFGVISLVILCFLTVFTAYKFHKTGDLHSSFITSLQKLEKQCKILKASYFIILAFKLITLVICIILIPKLYSESPSNEQEISFFLIGSAILFIGSSRVYKYYRSLLKQNENLLKIITQND